MWKLLSFLALILLIKDDCVAIDPSFPAKGDDGAMAKVTFQNGNYEVRYIFLKTFLSTNMKTVFFDS